MFYSSLCCTIEDKRKSIADFRDSSTVHGREKFPISVKAISALYLSKVAAADQTGYLLKPVRTCFCSSAPFAEPQVRGKEEWGREKPFRLVLRTNQSLDKPSL